MEPLKMDNANQENEKDFFLDFSDQNSAANQTTKKKPLPLYYMEKKFQILGLFAPQYAGKEAYKLWFYVPKIPQPKEARLITQNSTKETFLWDGHKIQSYEWGDGDKIAILMHGWHGFAGQFYQYIPKLVERGYKVLTIDGPKHGLSEGERSNLMYFSRAMQEFLKLRNIEKVDLSISHSGGGLAISHAYAEAGIQTDKFILISPFNEFRETVVRKHFGSVLNLSDRILDELEKLAVIEYGEDIWHIARVDNYLKGYKNTQFIFVHDQDDREIPIDQSYSLRAFHPESIMIKTSGLGHRRILRNSTVTDLVFKQLDTLS